jgi:hypothetical protein
VLIKGRHFFLVGQLDQVIFDDAVDCRTMDRDEPGRVDGHHVKVEGERTLGDALSEGDASQLLLSP